MRTEFENPSNGRWYTISITTDMFGFVILTTLYGGFGKRGESADFASV